MISRFPSSRALRLWICVLVGGFENGDYEYFFYTRDARTSAHRTPPPAPSQFQRKRGDPPRAPDTPDRRNPEGDVGVGGVVGVLGDVRPLSW